MSLFFTATEQRHFEHARLSNPAAPLLEALRERVARRAASPGRLDREATVDWWHCAAEYLTDAAFTVAVSPEPAISEWLRQAALGVARTDEQGWVGPPFRDHNTRPLVGNLETAHLSWSLAATLDLAPQVFSVVEREEITAALREHAIPQCRRWLERSNIVANWRCVLTAGLAVPAAVLDDRTAMAEAVRHFKVAVQAFQDDGSYGESLQYANYAAFHLMLAWEALVRRQPELAPELPLFPHSRFVHWAACSHLYLKPMGGGWGGLDRPRAANFGDSAAIFRPTADLLLHIATRTAALEPKTAGVARWLFDTLYLGQPGQGPWDRASFGFVNHFGFLALPLLAAAAPPLAPVQAGLPVLAGFDNGDVLARPAWDSSTILALRTGGPEPLACCGHLHGDLNSFILVHNRERLLIDPGHSCYRGLIHDLETQSRCHNTCTFTGESGFGLQEEVASGILTQQAPPRRLLDAQRQPLPPVQRPTRTLLCAREGAVMAVASEAAGAYGPGVREFTRLWLLAGANVLFVVDRIATARPLRTTWHWILNNRDGQLDCMLEPPHGFVMRRGLAGLKLVHAGTANLANVAHAFMHDAYHPKHGQLGEGRSGSATQVNFVEASGTTERIALFALVFDDAARLGDWQVETAAGAVTVRGGGESWSLRAGDVAHPITLQNGAGRQWTVDPGKWTFRFA